jgi:PAS domain S-box-containing protein
MLVRKHDRRRFEEASAPIALRATRGSYGDKMPATEGNLGEMLSRYPVVLFQVERDGKIVLAQGGAATSLGLEEAKAKNLRLSDIRSELGWLIEAVNSALNGANVTCQGNAADRTYDMVLHPHMDRSDRITGVFGIGFDVTEWARDAQERERFPCDEFRFEERPGRYLPLETELFSHLQLGVTVLDREYCCQFSNRYQLELFGYKSEDVMGRKPWELKPDVPRGPLEATFKRVLEGEIISGPVRPITRVDGSLVWATATVGPLRGFDGSIIGIVSVLRDQTAQLEAEVKLRQAEENFRGLIDVLPDPVGVAVDGIIAYANRAACDFFGYGSRQELAGQPLLDLFSSDARASAAQQLMRSAAGESIPPAEERVVTKSGETLVAEVRTRRAIFNGRPALLGIARDMTSQRKIHAQLLASERMASIGALTAGVGHEINNPLASASVNLDVIAARLDAMASEDALPPGVAELLEPLADARQALAQIRDIVRDLRLFSRGADIEDMRPVELTRIVDSALRMARNEIRHRASLIKQYEPVPLVFANESRLAQVVLNLVINAVQALPDGHAQSNQIKVITRTHQGQAVFEVQDTGFGMAPEVAKNLFSPFFTTKDGEHGLGLGLVICRRIVDDLGGRIEVESEPGHGSIFRVILPPASDAGPVIPTPKPSPVPEKVRPAKILVIDDELAIGRVIKRILSPYHEVTVMDRAGDALECIGNGGHFDVILCDLMMPEISGMEFFANLSQIAPETAAKVVFLTAGAFTPAARGFLATVPNSRLDKPFSINALKAAVSKQIK